MVQIVTITGMGDGTKTDEFSEKSQTAFDPTPLIFGISYCNFFSEKSIKKSCLEVQNLQHIFGLEDIPLPLWKFSKNSSVLVSSPVPDYNDEEQNSKQIVGIQVLLQAGHVAQTLLVVFVFLRCWNSNSVGHFDHHFNLTFRRLFVSFVWPLC